MTHEELIICPDCLSVECASVEHTLPFFSYVHECRCGYLITESEWNEWKDLAHPAQEKEQ